MNWDIKIKLASKVALISGAFVLIICILLLLNYIQIRSHDPLESKSLQSLVERLSREPDNNNLKIEIRDLDLLARKAFFTGQWQIMTGVHLLLFGSIILIFALRIYYSLTSVIEKPGGSLTHVKRNSILSQRWILIFGAFLVTGAFLAAYLTKDELNKFESGTLFTDSEISPDEEIEQIGIVEGTSDSFTDQNLPDSPASSENRGLLPDTKPGEERSFPSAEIIRQNHNAFRGPMGNGVSYHKNIPVDWDGNSGKNILWKIRVPKAGKNSPVIWNEKLFIAGSDLIDKVVYCYNRNTGKLIWQKKADNIPGSPADPPKTTDDTGLSAPTLTTEGNGVYTIFGTGDIIAFDMNGTRMWARNLGVPDNHYGHASSLITYEDKLFIQFDSNKGGKLIALNTLTGETTWEKTRATKISWASPILIRFRDKIQIVLSADPIVAGYDTETGNEDWAVKCMTGEVGPSPAFSDGLVFAANEYAKLAAIDPGTKSIVWEDNEYLPEVSSPVAGNGLLFIATSYGVLVCYDARTGEKQWEEEFDRGFYSSPVIADNKVYIIDLDGVTHIFELSRQLRSVGNPELGEKVVATPAFAESRIYIRGEKNLYCIGI